MPIPAVLAGLAKSYLADKAMEKFNVPQDIRTVVDIARNPKGYVRDKIKDAIKEKIGMGNERGSSAPLDEGSFPDDYPEDDRNAYKKGGKVKRSLASKRGDGIAKRGKTKGRMV